MAVCLATTTGDTVDDDHIVELVRGNDEWKDYCLLNMGWLLKTCKDGCASSLPTPSPGYR